MPVGSARLRPGSAAGFEVAWDVTQMTADPADPWLVPDRQCDGCTVCCAVLPIDTPQFQKQSGVLCTHCAVGAGCTIHATRPPVCREWYCGWRYLAFLTDAMRPDRGGILPVFDTEDIPDGYSIRPAVKFIVTGGVEALRAMAFLEVVAALARQRLPMFLAAPGPPGRHMAKSFLNAGLEAAAADGAPAGVNRVMEGIYALLIKGEFEPILLKNAPARGPRPLTF